MAARIGPYAVSIAFHAVLLGLLAISIRTPVIAQRPAASRQVQPIQAVAVDSAKVEAEVQRLRAQQHRRRVREIEKQRRIRQQEAHLAALNRERKAEAAQAQRKLEQLKQQQAAEKKRAAEQKRLEQLAAQRKMAQEQARIKRQAVADLKRQMAAEAKRLQQEQQTAQTAADNRYRAQYVADIANRVQRNWLRPPGATQDFTCKVLVKQIPTGDVIAVQIVKSCGNPVLDRSVEDAVRKSSPLPPPPVPEVFDREIEFTFSSSTQ